ncbi:alpha/beta hydrolase [Robertkochia solimangrovi]|uniref:alpha/beta hydrolase n=1 Tax=Robertkochia solimangrovi TaxID=2213046 RepID=UPI00117E308D|nr:alpha/beta hydrolase-fold protein [Robertkochia solimangrovi]TRZ41622.1 esterase family protein [Robertkochia solimangrovi]
MKKHFLTFLIFIISVSLKASTVDTLTVYSASMQKEIKCVVIKPDSYAKGDQQYPVVYLLHGYSDNYAFWVKEVPEIKKYADDFQMILVCPDGGYNSWYYDSPVKKSSRFETHITREILPYVDTHYRTQPDRKHRGITGLSMGGHGALYLALRHTDLFGAAGSTSGGVDIKPFKKHWELTEQVGDSIQQKDNWEKMSVINMIDEYPTRQLSLIIDCGTDDFFYTVNKNLHEKLLQQEVPHDYTERPGGHTLEYWQNSIGYQLLFFFKFFEAPNTFDKG